jgi:hypothetical protein
MSQRTLDVVIRLLLSNDEIRARFERDPLGTVAGWLNAGWRLTGSEIDALVELDAAMWSRGSDRRDADAPRAADHMWS